MPVIHARVTIITLNDHWQLYCVCGSESDHDSGPSALNAAYEHFVNSDVHDHRNSRLFIDMGPIRAI